MGVRTWIAGLLGALLCAEVLAAAPQACRQDSLRISIIPVKNMGHLVEDYKPLADLLSTELQLPVRILHASSYEAVVDAVISGAADIARLGPASYLHARQRDATIEPFASLAPAPGHFSVDGSYYSSLLLVRADSDMTSLQDTRGRTVVLNDPASTSGALIPRHEFGALIGEPLESYFSSQTYAGSHDRALDALLRGSVDAAFVSSERADEYLAQGRMDRRALRVLWRSEPIHYDPLVFSRFVCEDIRQRVRELMFTPSPKLDEFFDKVRAHRAVPVTHADYESLLPRIGG